MKKFILVACILMMFCMPVTADVKIVFEENEPQEIKPANTIYKSSIKRSLKADNYGYISIPKLGLKNKFVEKGNIDRNIIMISPSKYPNVENSILILAGHSGSGRYAYFNYLYKLKNGDEIIIGYMGNNYKYKIVKIYKQIKDGSIKTYKIKNKKTLVLVTCTNNDKKTQTVYLAAS